MNQGKKTLCYERSQKTKSTRLPKHVLTCAGELKRSLVTVAEVGQDNAVALVKLDDGKMNAFSFDMISAIDSAMEDCRDAGAIVISGNEKCLSAGFDLSVMGKGPSPEAGDMLRKGCELAIKIAEFPRPTIFAAGGHAMALGAIMLFTGDLRIGVSDNAKAKIGLNEVHIGMPLPIVGMELARWRLSAKSSHTCHYPGKYILAIGSNSCGIFG